MLVAKIGLLHILKLEECVIDLSSILSLLEKANINTNEVQDLIYEASRLDLSNEDNVRSLIRKSAKLANKDISIEKENQIISILKEKGISSDLFSLLR